MMKRRLITALMGVGCLLLSNMSKAGTLKLYPTNDAYINNAEPTSVHNSNTVYAGYSAETTRTYLKFDLSAIPDGQSIVSAVLRLDTNYLSSSPVTGSPVIGAYYLDNDNWSESTLTWNNAPTNFSMLPTNTQSISTGDVFWTVKSDVSQVYGDDDIYSVVMKLTHEVFAGAKAGFWSKDAGTADTSPYLTIEYQPIPEPATLLLLTLGGLTVLRKKK
jgi:hypothetical protein